MVFRFLTFAAVVALSACAASPAPEAQAPAPIEAAGSDGPPTENGVYVYPGCEGEGGCGYTHWRARERVPMLAAIGADAEVIGTLQPGEWIITEELQTRLIPTRGVVQKTTERFRAGEVVYQLWYQGEGWTTIWRNGREETLEDGAPVDIAWEAAPALAPEVAATLGLWVRARREKDGLVGWIHVTHHQFECVGPLAGDADCRD